MPLSRTQASRYAVLSLAIAALLLPIAWIEHSVLQYTHGVMTYPLDDTFIHMAVAKNLPLTESKSVLFRVEAFNIFNHTQFSGPTSVDGDIGSSTFGNVISAASPRILQGALKLNF